MRVRFVVAGLLLLAGCDQKTAQRQETVAQAPPAAAAVAAKPLPHALVAADTALPFTTLLGFSDSARASLLVQINGTPYRVQTAARTDSARPVSYTYPDSPSPDFEPGDSTQSNTETGYEGYYTFRLLRPDGKPQFERRLKKSDFAQTVGEGQAVVSGTEMPIFMGYLPQFKALAFELSFYPAGGSDDGGQVLLLLDAATGQVRHQGLSQWTAGCNSPTTVSADGRLLLTGFELLQANGAVKHLERPGRLVGGTLLLNDQTALVVYVGGFDRRGTELPLHGPNAELLAATGKKLASFSLMALDGGLGYQLLAKYIAPTRTFYLFDETHRKLGLIPRDSPATVKALKLNQLPAFRAPQRPTEIRISFNTETGTQARFYVDTVSQQIRHTYRKPRYKSGFQ